MLLLVKRFAACWEALRFHCNEGYLAPRRKVKGSVALLRVISYNIPDWFVG